MDPGTCKDLRECFFRTCNGSEIKREIDEAPSQVLPIAWSQSSRVASQHGKLTYRQVDRTLRRERRRTHGMSDEVMLRLSSKKP